jgi:Transposase DNA-binding
LLNSLVRVRMTQTMSWAQSEFGTAQLGDIRRTRRLVTMAAAVARAPSGKVSAVFNGTKEREGAYDFLESRLVKTDSVAESVFAATAARARGVAFAYVIIDGSSLTLTDAKGEKGFGPVGTRTQKANGLICEYRVCGERRRHPHRYRRSSLLEPFPYT